MKPEWRKIRSLPLPRALAVLVLLGSAAGSGSTEPAIGLLLAGTLATIVFAVWMFALEPGSGTLARTFAAEPRRTRVLARKAVLATLLPAAVLALGGALVLVLSPASLREVAGSAAQAALVAPIAFGLAVLTRSLAGGIAASLALLQLLPGVFVLAGVTAVSPTIALQSLHDRIAGTTSGFGITEHAGIALGTTLLVVAGWGLATPFAGAARLTARDV